MITLKDVSLIPYIESAEKKQSHDRTRYYSSLFKELRITDCQILADLIEAGHPLLNTLELRSFISRIELSIKSLNERPQEQKIINFSKYDEFEETVKNRFIITDIQVSGDSLPIYYPNYRSSIEGRLAEYSIDTLKSLLGKLSFTGKRTLENAFIGTFSGANTKAAQGVIKGIQFYEEQVIRTYLELTSLQSIPKNIFTSQTREKEELVKMKFNIISRYLISHGEQFIWDFFPTEKKKNLAKALNPNLNTYDITKERLQRIIIDYITLREIEGNIEQNGALNRFIIKPKKPLK